MNHGLMPPFLYVMKMLIFNYSKGNIINLFSINMMIDLISCLFFFHYNLVASYLSVSNVGYVNGAFTKRWVRICYFYRITMLNGSFYTAPRTDRAVQCSHNLSFLTDWVFDTWNKPGNHLYLYTIVKVFPTSVIIPPHAWPGFYIITLQAKYRICLLTP